MPCAAPQFRPIALPNPMPLPPPRLTPRAGAGPQYGRGMDALGVIACVMAAGAGGHGWPGFWLLAILLAIHSTTETQTALPRHLYFTLSLKFRPSNQLSGNP